MTEEKNKRDIGYKIKERAKSFDSKNGQVTYTLKELIKALSEDISELSDDIQDVNDKLIEFMVIEIKEITALKTSLSLYKKLTISMLIGVITFVLSQVTIL